MKITTIASCAGIILVLLLVSITLISDDTSIHCKGDAGSTLFSYNSVFNTVNIGGYPTYQPGDPWVDFIETKDEGFIIVSSQKTYDREINDLRAKKHVYRYQAGEGFTFWHDVPPEDAARVKGLNNPPTQKATNIYTDCGNQVGGTLIQMLITANRV